MTPQITTPLRVTFTPVQRLIVIVMVLLAGGFAVVLFRVPPKAERIWDWSYPNCTFLGSAGLPSGQCYMISTPDSFTKVTGHYLQRLRLGTGTGGALFTGVFRGILPFGRSMEQIGVVFSPALDAVQSATLVSFREGQVKVIHASRSAGDSNTTVWLTFLDTGSSGSGTPFPASSQAVNKLMPPKGTRGSGGQTLNLSMHAFTAPTQLDRLDYFYWQAFGATNGSGTNASTVAGVAGGQPRFVRLPSPPRSPTNELAYLLLGGRSMSFIHCAANSNDTTHGIISSASY